MSASKSCLSIAAGVNQVERFNNKAKASSQSIQLDKSNSMCVTHNNPNPRFAFHPNSCV